MSACVSAYLRSCMCVYLRPGGLDLTKFNGEALRVCLIHLLVNDSPNVTMTSWLTN